MSVVIKLDLRIDTELASAALSELPDGYLGRSGWNGRGLSSQVKTGSSLEQLLNSIPGEMARAACLTLSPESEKEMHTDKRGNGQWVMGLDVGEVVGIHIPLQTNESSFMESADGPVPMEVGSAYALCVWHPHKAVNGGATERVHLLRDTFVDAELLALLDPIPHASARHEEYSIEDQPNDDRIVNFGSIGDEEEDCCEEKCDACEDE